MDGRANPRMDRQVAGVVPFGVIAMVTSPTTAECRVVLCCAVLCCSVLLCVVLCCVV